MRGEKLKGKRMSMKNKKKSNSHIYGSRLYIYEIILDTYGKKGYEKGENVGSKIINFDIVVNLIIIKFISYLPISNKNY